MSLHDFPWSETDRSRSYVSEELSLSFSIKNIEGERIFGEITNPFANRTVISGQGLGGSRHQNQIRYVRDIYAAAGYSVVTYDASKSLSDSDGNFSEFTLTSHINDLYTVIDQLYNQGRIQKPFDICGFSLGGSAAFVYASMYHDVKQVFCIAPVVSGQWYLNAMRRWRPGMLDAWESRGYIEKESSVNSGRLGKLPYSFIEDLIRYNLITLNNNKEFYVNLFASSCDETVDAQSVKMLWESIGSYRSKYIELKSPHTITDESDLEELGERIKCIISES